MRNAILTDRPNTLKARAGRRIRDRVAPAAQSPQPPARDAARASNADSYWKEKLHDAAVGIGDVILLGGFVLVMLYDLMWFGR